MINLLFIATIVNNMYISWDQVWCLCNQHNHHQNDDNHHQYDDKKHQHDGNVLKINFHNSFASASWIYHQHEEITTPPPSLPIPSHPSPFVSSSNLRILMSPFGQKSPVWTRKFWEYPDISGNNREYQGISLDIGEYHGIPGNYRNTCRVCQSYKKNHRDHLMQGLLSPAS